MNPKRTMLSLGLLSLGAMVHAGAQSTDVTASLKQTLGSRRQSAATAWHNKDAKALKSMMAPDFLFTSPQATVPREGWLASLSSRLAASLCMLTWILSAPGDA